MAGTVSTLTYVAEHHRRRSIEDPRWMRTLLITVTLLFVVAFLVVPLVLVFTEALRKGWGVYLGGG